jgi:hypothetical protein
MPAISTGLALGLGIAGAAGSIGGAAIASHGASSAAGAQAGAAEQAAQLQHQDAQAALDFQKQQLGIQQQNAAPWLASGRGALSSLDNLMGITPQGSAATGASPGTLQTSGLPASQTIDLARGGDGVYSAGGGRMPLSALRGGPMQAGEFSVNPTNPLRGGTENGVPTFPAGSGVAGAAQPGAPAGGPGTPGFGSLLQGYDKTFTAPTDVTEQNDPGYKFRLSQGLDALQNSAAARGGLLSGGTAKAINDYAQNSASAEYGNVYNRALGQYQQGYNIFQNDQANKFNRLSAMSGTGQTAAGQLNSASQGASGNVANILLGSGQQIGNSLQNAGAARASGYAAGSNALSGGLSGGLGDITQMLLLKNLLGGSAASGAGTPFG